MSKIKNKDRIYIEESMLTEFTLKDIDSCSGIKIKNSANTCYLKRFNQNGKDYYWAECKLISNVIKELEILSEPELLNILNQNKSNYALIK